MTKRCTTYDRSLIKAMDSVGVPPLPSPNREVKPKSADGTANVCGRVGHRHFFSRSSEWKFGASFFVYTYSSFVPKRSKRSGTNLASRSRLLFVPRCEHSSAFRLPRVSLRSNLGNGVTRFQWITNTSMIQRSNSPRSFPRLELTLSVARHGAGSTKILLLHNFFIV